MDAFDLPRAETSEDGRMSDPICSARNGRRIMIEFSFGLSSHRIFLKDNIYGDKKGEEGRRTL